MNEVERPIRQPPDCLSPAGQMGLGATPQNKQSTRRVANPEPEEKVVTRIKTTQKKGQRCSGVVFMVLMFLTNHL
jgi:hypothetical protein